MSFQFIESITGKFIERKMLEFQHSCKAFKIKELSAKQFLKPEGFQLHLPDCRGCFRDAETTTRN